MDVENWTIKKAEHWGIDFKLWCWRRFLRIPWTARWSNQSILKEINPEYSLEELMLKLKLQYFGQRPWCWERSRAAGEGDDRGWDGWRASLTQWTWAWASSGSWWRTGKPGMLQSMRLQSPTWLNNWTSHRWPKATMDSAVWHALPKRDHVHHGLSYWLWAEHTHTALSPAWIFP